MSRPRGRSAMDLFYLWVGIVGGFAALAFAIVWNLAR